MTTSINKLTIAECCSLAAWDIAERLGIAYSGDANCLEHGGVFYSRANWTEYGYASAVEFWTEGNTLHIMLGTINKPSGGITDHEILETYGTNIERSLDVEVDIARSNWGIEPDCYAGQPKPFNLEAWKEERIWKMVLPHIVALAAE